MHAHLLIRRDPQYRRDAFEAGLKACGYTIAGEPRANPVRGDILVIWNRYGRAHATATAFERAGCRVLVAENGPLGRDWQGEPWYSLVEGNPAGAGSWQVGGPERWESFGANICDWRKSGREIIVLAQRGIGPPGIAQPAGWHERTAFRLAALSTDPVRIRRHPGEQVPRVPLEDDLADARLVVTWSSGAALKALLLGVPVAYGFDRWIGAQAAARLPSVTLPAPSYPDRLPMFRRLAWSMWRTRELATGLPFQGLTTLRSTTSGTTTARS